nr:hypothetical protein [Tanacetum cinerariifolium]
MASLADKAILSGVENRPPMLEKDMYDYWRSRMELYMLNRQHGRMILESVEHGPLIWPSVTEDGETRLKNILNCHQLKLLKPIAMLKQRILFFKPFLGRFMHWSANLSTSSAVLSPTSISATSINISVFTIYNIYHTPQFVSQGSSSNLSISYPINDTSSTVNHNAYMASAPQIDNAPIAHHSSELSSLETGLVVPVFQKRDDPIDAINHMMFFLTSVVTSRGGRIICRLVRQDRLHQDQEEHLEGKG